MKILIIGASGMLGGEILDRARGRGDWVFGTRASSDRPDLLPFDLRTDRIAEDVAKSIDPQFFSNGERVFAIVCASICQIDRCAREKHDSRLVNVEKTIAAIDDLGKLGAKVCFVSSSYVFDGTHIGCTEDQPHGPICEYGRHKAEVENHLRGQAPDALVVRFDKLVDDRPRPGNMLLQWEEQSSATGRILCIADQYFAPTAIGDAAEAIFLACEQNLTGVYHVANSECFSRSELARRYLKIRGVQAEVVAKPQSEFPFADPRPLKTCLDSRKFRGVVKMRYTPVEELIRSFVAKIPT